MKHLVLIFVLVIFADKAFTGNFFEHYQPLESEGPVPEHLLTLSSKKFEERLKDLKTEDRRERRVEERFTLSASFSIDRMLRNGTLLFNDTLTRYVNRLADVILQDSPDLREEIKIYVIRNAHVNAFASDEGVILVCMGLLAQVENEAQLAFVLGHEIIHYIQQHAITRFMEAENIRRGRSVFQNPRADDRMLSIHAFSRDLEIEADEGGLSYLKKTGYDLAEAEKVFDVLHYAYLPFAERVFEPNFLTTGDSKVPKGYMLEEVSPIRVDREGDMEETATHPSTTQRKQIIVEMIDEVGQEEGKRFILPEEEFRFIQNVARFEQTYAYLKSGDYARTLYNVFLLERNFPDNQFLTRLKVEALYAISKHYNRNQLRNVLPRHRHIEGQSQQLYFILNAMTREDLNIFALAKAYEARQQFPDEIAFEVFYKELIEDLFVYHDVLPKMFLKEAPEPDDETEDEAQADEQEDDESKYARIRQLRRTTVEKEEQFNRLAFTHIFQQDKDFMGELEKAYNRSLDIEKQDVASDAGSSERVISSGKSGIKKIVEIEPMYFRVDARRQLEFDYLGAEEMEFFLEDEVEGIAKNLGVSVTHLKMTNLETGQIDAFNEMAFIKRWYSSRISGVVDVPVSSGDMERINRLVEKYNTPYFSWRGVINLKERKPNIIGVGILSMVFPPMLPLFLYRALSPNHSTLYFNVVFNIQTGEIAHLYVSEFGYADNNNYLRSNIYDNIQLMSLEK